MRGVTPDSYLAQPVGKYVCGSTYAAWCKNQRLNGIVFWGRPDEDDIVHLARVLDAEGPSDAPPHASLVDARYVETVDLGAFAALSHYVRSRGDEISRVVARQALLRSDSLVGAVVAGFYEVLPPAYPVAVFTAPEPALDWLGVADEFDVIAELDAVRAQATGRSRLVTLLRAHLDERFASSSLNTAASALGTSPRNLQRRLREYGTHFQAELNAAQLRAAQTLMLETNHDLKRIAIEVGCASLPHFSVLHRRLTGESPSGWRAKRRGI